MNAARRRRQRPPTIVWLVLGLLGILALLSAALGTIAIQGAERVQGLQGTVVAVQEERRGVEVRLEALQATAAAVENRLAAVEANDTAGQLDALRAAVESTTTSTQFDELRRSLAEVQAEVSGFQSTLDELEARTGALNAVQDTPGNATLPREVKLNVARQRQSHSLSCEASASSMVAQYLGVDLSEAEVLAALPFNDNPHLGFRGNVDGPTGSIEDYGVYAGPVADLLNAQGLRAGLVEGGLDGVRAAISRGNPVIAWVTYDCLPGTPQVVTIGDQAVTLVPNQHVVVLTGYDGEGVWANDPYDGLEDYYRNSDLSRAMGYFGDMALEVSLP